jgi:uncharacterized protein (TIGR00730 family)
MSPAPEHPPEGGAPRPPDPADAGEEARIQAILRSPSYRMAFEDPDFIMRHEMRPARLQLELMKPEIALRQHRIRSTVVVFGGTRIVEPAVARARIAELERDIAAHGSDPQRARRLAVAQRVLAKSRYYDEAREFGRLVSQGGQDGGAAEYVVVTGGGPGIMEAANRGAFDIGAKSIGFNITLPFEQQPNSYITPELCFQFHYFAVRKMHFMLRAKALVAFPGGYGTMDELFEALTLLQTHKARALPVILFGREFWDHAVDLRYLADEGTIAEEDLALFRFADTAAEAWEMIQRYHANRRGAPPRR